MKAVGSQPEHFLSTRSPAPEFGMSSLRGASNAIANCGGVFVYNQYSMGSGTEFAVTPRTSEASGDWPYPRRSQSGFACIGHRTEPRAVWP